MNGWIREDVDDEVAGGRASLATKCGIPESDIQGFRQPFLQASPTVREVRGHVVLWVVRQLRVQQSGAAQQATWGMQLLPALGHHALAGPAPAPAPAPGGAPLPVAAAAACCLAEAARQHICPPILLSPCCAAGAGSQRLPLRRFPDREPGGRVHFQGAGCPAVALLHARRHPPELRRVRGNNVAAGRSTLQPLAAAFAREAAW